MRMWRKGGCSALLAGMQTGTVTAKENSSSLIDFIYLFLERWERRVRERERNINQMPLICAPSRNLGMCPDQESNLQLFILWDDNQLSHTSLGSIVIYSLDTFVIGALLKL